MAVRTWVVASGLLVLTALPAGAEVCADHRYGSPDVARRIERVMQSGSRDEVAAAIHAAQRTRARELGCAERGYTVLDGDDRPPTSGAVLEAWQAHANALVPGAAMLDRCPMLGRSAGAFALGGWLAKAAGLAANEPALRGIADNLVNTQFHPQRSPGEQPAWSGLYGYAARLGDPGDACHVAGVVGEATARLCSDVPELCVWCTAAGALPGNDLALATTQRPEGFETAAPGSTRGGRG